MKKKGSEIIIECLLEQGVDTVFGYPGGSVLEIYDALYSYKDKIKHIITAHEQGATHAADGYARSTGRVGVAIVTSGPGATNTVTAIATAYMDSSPIVVISGNVATNCLGLDSFQEVDITGITMPITKHNFIVKDINSLSKTIDRAFEIAKEGRPGPVLVDIPKDITQAEIYYEKTEKKDVKNESKLDINSLNRVVEEINKSSKPFIYTGGGVISSKNCHKKVEEFVYKVDGFVSSSLMSQGAFDNTDERYLGMLGMHGTIASSKASSACDLLIAIGTRFSDRVTLNIESFAKKAKIIQIEIDPVEINKNVMVHEKIIGDASEILEYLIDHIKQKENKEWLKEVEEYKKCDLSEITNQKSGKPTPKDVIEKISELTENSAILTTEVGQNQMWAAHYYKFTQPRQFITSGGLGTMGFGLGAAIGAQIANPNKRVINIAGDGSFLMNCNELVTVSKYQIPLIEVVLNNNVLGMVRQWQKLIYNERYSQTTLDRNIDYMKLAQAFSINSSRITKASEVQDVIKKALKEKVPYLIEVEIDKDEYVLPMVKAGGDINSPITQIK